MDLKIVEFYIGSNMIHAQVFECTHHHVGVCDIRGA